MINVTIRPPEGCVFTVPDPRKQISCLIPILIKSLEIWLAECSSTREAPPTSHSLFHLLKTPISLPTTLRGNSSAKGTVLKSTNKGKDDIWGKKQRRKSSGL